MWIWICCDAHTLLVNNSFPVCHEFIKGAREKQRGTYEGSWVRWKADFSSETMEAIFKGLKGKDDQLRIPWTAKLPCKIQEELRHINKINNTIKWHKHYKFFLFHSVLFEFLVRSDHFCPFVHCLYICTFMLVLSCTHTRFKKKKPTLGSSIRRFPGSEVFLL